jgi:acetylornithine deacetylase
VIASVGTGTGKTLMLNGHTDTVGVAGMPEPFPGRVDGSRLYGRGAADMKNALAAMIVLLEEVARTGDFPGRLIATFVVDEEYASIGTTAICREIDRWRPDAALVLEATALDVEVAHKGFIWAEIVTRGRAAHGSRYQDGVDAIAQMGHVLVGLDELARELVTRPPHPLVGPPSLHASLIRGGQELSSYPDECRLEIERRTIPGETAEQVRGELQAILDRVAASDPGFRATLELGLVRHPFAVPEDAPIVQAVVRAAEAERGAAPKLIGAGGWADSALLMEAGVPTVIFGTEGEGAHAMEEWADLDNLERFGRALVRVAYDFCAG